MLLTRAQIDDMRASLGKGAQPFTKEAIDSLCALAFKGLAPAREAQAIELLRQARECVAHCVSVDDGSWAQHNPHYAALLAKIDAMCMNSGRT